MSTVVRLDTHQPFRSVGLVCTCGHAVAGIEAVVTTCRGCGAQYLLTVLVIAESRAREPEAASTTEGMRSSGA